MTLALNPDRTDAAAEPPDLPDTKLPDADQPDADQPDADPPDADPPTDISIMEVRDQFGQCNPSKAANQDNISTRVLKYC